MSETTKLADTYKTLNEQKETLSPAEERFERVRQTVVGLFLDPIDFLVLYLLPMGLLSEQQASASLRVRHHLLAHGADPDPRDGRAMLPICTPPNAIVYGYGMIPIIRMVRSGVFFDVISAVLIVTIMAQVLGLA